MSDRRALFGPVSAILLLALSTTMPEAAPPALGDPLILGIAPTAFQEGQQVLVTGVNFGAAPEVRFAGVVAPILVYRPDLGRLITTVPGGVSSGALTVTDTLASKTSNPADYELLGGVYTPLCTISGNVTDPGSAPVAGALAVAIDPATDLFAALSSTDGGGAYSIGLASAGNYNLLFVAPEGSVFHDLGYEVVCSGVQNHQFAVGRALEGRVVDGLSAPIENAPLRTGGGANNDAEGLSSASGEFSLRVPEGTYDLLVEGPVGGRWISEELRDLVIDADTDLGDIVLDTGELVTGSLVAQFDGDTRPAMSAHVGEYDGDGSLAGTTTSIADGSFYLPSPTGDLFSLSISGDRSDLEDRFVFSLAVSGDLELENPLTLFSRGGQLPSTPRLVRADALRVQRGQRLAFEAVHLQGTDGTMLFPDGAGGSVEGLDTLVERTRGAVVTTVPSTAASGPVVLRIDGVSSPGYPLEIVAGTYDPGPFSTSGVIDDGALPVEGAFVAMLSSTCFEDALVDYDITGPGGAYSVDHGAGNLWLLVLPPVESGLAMTYRELPGVSGSRTEDFSLEGGYEVTARCVDGGVGVVGGDAPLPDCYLLAEGESLELEEDALGNSLGELLLNLPGGSYAFELWPPFESRYLAEGGSVESIVEDTDFGDQEFASGYFLEGYVEDPSGEGLPGVEVAAFAFGGFDEGARGVTTGAEGRFLLAVEPGVYDLYFEAHEDQELFVPPRYGLEVYSDYLSHPAIVAQEVGYIEGLVTDGAALAVPGVSLRAFEAGYGYVDEAPSCEDGSFRLRVPSGSFTVEANASGQGLCLADETYDNHFRGCGADPVPVTAPETVSSIDFVLDPAGTVSGDVRDDAGSGVAGVTVCAIAGDSLGFCSEVCVLSESGGAYEIEGVPVGADHKLQAFGAGFPTECWDDHVNCLTYDPVSVTECVVSGGIDFLMSGAPGPVPDGRRTAGTMMTATYDEGGDLLVIDWQPTCSADNHAAFFGSLGDFSTYTHAECVMGVVGSQPVSPPPGNVFWVVAGVNETREGSFGVDSDLNERASDDAALCGYAQDLSATCVP